MKKVYCSVLALVALVSGIITASAQKLPYQDENLPYNGLEQQNARKLQVV